MSFKQDLQIDWHKLREAGSEPPASLFDGMAEMMFDTDVALISMLPRM
jgi:hypothetical protein